MRNAAWALTFVGVLAMSTAVPAADWKAEADRSIGRVRKDDAVVEVVDAAGKPVAGAAVKADLQRHAFWFGTAINASMFRPNADPDDARRYQEILLKDFNSVVHENAMKWYHTQREGGEPDFTDADRMVEWATKHGLLTRGHCIFWGKYKYLPAWQKDLSDEALREAVLARAERITSRYRGVVDEWDLNNEMTDPNFYADRLGVGIIKDMARSALKGDPDAVLYVNDYGMLNLSRLKPYEKQIEELLAMGVPIGGIGVQGHFNTDAPDPAKVKEALDRLARFKLPIRVTEFDCRHGETDEDRADGLEVVYRVAFAHPSVTGILMWGFWEGRHWQPPAALYAKDWTKRAQGERYEQLVLREWQTHESGRTGAQGQLRFRGFHGDYAVEVTGPDGAKVTETFTLEPNKANRFVVRLP